ncbi:MAG: hypothetical protein JSR18_04705 [Proteobacteria bacterium]|nr:hypothetical protein [Pseudomonadota bacterium]
MIVDTRFVSHLARAARLLAAAMLPAAAVAGGLPTSVPPYVPPTPMARTMAAPTALMAPASSTPLAIVLPAPTAAELAAPTATAVPGQKRLLARNIGIGRAIPEATRAIPMAALRWQRGADGSDVASVRVTSTGAAAVRVAVRMAAAADPDAVVRIAGASGVVYGPYTLNAIAQATATLGEWWTPVVDGDTLTIEISEPAGTLRTGSPLSVVELSHLTTAGADTNAAALSRDGNLGRSGTCEVNWKCAPTMTDALTNAASGVARMIFTEADGTSWLCSGTLMNDSISSGTPYFSTAAHCMDTAYAARTLNTYWFLDAPDGDCGHTTAVGPFVQLTGGAMLLGHSPSQDWALVRLHDTPPAGTHFSAWNSTPITSGAMIALHHPEGDTKKYSEGAITPGPDGGYIDVRITNDDGTAEVLPGLIQVYWSLGITEGGSSGSGLLTSSSKGYYEFRGALTAGDVDLSCTKPSGGSYYSRMDKMLPLVRDYLTPGNTVPNTAVVVEYYSQALDAYFITASADDQNALDTGVFAGWERTGVRFLAYTAPVSGAVGVCRFYQIPAYGDSHFYGLPTDCAAVTGNPTQFPGWVLEHPSPGNPTDFAFYMRAPLTPTSCPANTAPVWRFFHSARTNHRFVTDPIIKAQLDADSGWADEGIRMCGPVGS